MMSMEKSLPMYRADTILKFYSKYRILFHILFWVGYVLYEGVIWGMVDDGYGRRLHVSLIELPVKILATYFTIYVLIDRLLLQEKYLQFFIYLVVSVLFFVVVLRILAYEIIYPKYYPESLDVIPMLWPPKMLIAFFYIYCVTAIVATFHLARIWFLHQQETQLIKQNAEQLEKEKVTAQLQLLKSQINPHFLFNTLNNLYSLTRSKSDKAPEMVVKLSELMSYMLYESNKEEVFLDKEIQYLENYIALEQLRYEDDLDVNVKIYGDSSGIKIAPLLILPLVENGFKHGASKQLSDSWILIDISIDQQKIKIKVENSKNNLHDNGKNHLKPKIGIENLRERLSLIYPNRHSLQIFEEADKYLVVMEITLNGVFKKKKDSITHEMFSS